MGENNKAIVGLAHRNICSLDLSVARIGYKSASGLFSK